MLTKNYEFGSSYGLDITLLQVYFTGTKPQGLLLPKISLHIYSNLKTTKKTSCLRKGL